MLTELSYKHIAKADTQSKKSRERKVWSHERITAEVICPPHEEQWSIKRKH